MSDIIYISLGSTCDPRVYITKTLGKSKKNGYKTCVFDLCITNFNDLCNCIEDDFKHFFDNLTLIPGTNANGDRSKCGNGNLNITNYYNMIFNHESPTHSHLHIFGNGKNDDLFFIKNDFSEFKKRYNDRINNFRNYINNHKNITFIYKKMNNDQSFNLEKLKNILNNKYSNKNINILEI